MKENTQDILKLLTAYQYRFYDQVLEGVQVFVVVVVVLVVQINLDSPHR